jgi:hypothetical protein
VRGVQQAWERTERVHNTGEETLRDRPIGRRRRFGVILKKKEWWVEIRSIRLRMRNRE